MLPAANTQAVHHARTGRPLVVACIDFRFIGDELDALIKQKRPEINDNYDLLIVPGAAAALDGTNAKALMTERSWRFDTILGTYDDWKATFLRTLDARNSKEVIFVDHRDCGAYTRLVPSGTDAVSEFFEHRKSVNNVREQLDARYGKEVVHVSAFLACTDKMTLLDLDTDEKRAADVGVPSHRCRAIVITGIDSHTVGDQLERALTRASGLLRDRYDLVTVDPMFMKEPLASAYKSDLTFTRNLIAIGNSLHEPDQIILVQRAEGVNPELEELPEDSASTLRTIAREFLGVLDLAEPEHRHAYVLRKDDELYMVNGASNLKVPFDLFA